jgi:hypothetical protein
MQRLDASLDLLEYTVKHSLTNANPKQITFVVQDDKTRAPKLDFGQKLNALTGSAELGT